MKLSGSAPTLLACCPESAQHTLGRKLIYPMLTALLLLGFAATGMAAEKKSPQVQVIYPVNRGVSQPLRDMKAPMRPVKASEEDAALPVGYPKRQEDQQPNRPEAPVQDPVLQKSEPVGTMPATAMNFEGLNNIGGYYPPDTCGDVGPNHYVQITNVYYQVYDKTTGAALLPSALPNNAMWSGLPDGSACKTTNDGDPIVLYDQFADRWLFSQFSVGGPYYQCIAISQTGDPTGSWYLYEYQMSATVMNDYPKFGVWPDGYYMAINQFDPSWAGQGVVAFDRATMLTGGAAAMQYLDLKSSHPNLGAMLPADADGATAPPAGAPNYFVQVDDDGWGYAADQLEVYEFSVDWATPANTTFTAASTSPVAVSAFTTLNGTTVPQPDTTQLLDNLGDRLMYRLQYRNFGTHQSMVVNHTVDTTGSGNGVAGIRWYELRDSGSDWALHQEGTYGGDAANTEHRWMGSIAMDSDGNMGLGYSVSSTTTYPSIRYVGRLTGDTPGTMGQGESEIIGGSGSQTGSAARWGDYSMMSVDPVDDCTFWYTTEYYETTSATGWQTHIASFTFPGCSAPTSGVLEGTVTNSLAAFVEGVTITADDGASIQLSTTTADDGSYSFASLPVGTYTVTAEKFGYVTGTAPGVTIVDSTTTIQDFVLADEVFYTLSGTVTDSTTGWPLYAEVDYNLGSVWTDPVTGMYFVDLPQGNHSVVATADGYDPAGATMNLNTDTVQDFGLQADTTCSAPGYSYDYLYNEDFESSDGSYTHSGTLDNWEYGTPVSWPSSCASGVSCWGTDLDADHGNGADETLLSPVIDLSAISTPGDQLTALWSQALHMENSFWDQAHAEVNINGGGWTAMWSHTESVTVQYDWHQVSYDISAAAGGTVQFRWRIASDLSIDYSGYYVDDVLITAPDCIVPVDGGLVIGNVYDANTSSSLNGVLIDDGGGNIATTVATPGDDNLDDGFYSLYLPASGTTSLTATLAPYATVAEAVTVPMLGTVEQNFNLPAGLLTADPNPVEVHIAPDSTLSLPLDMLNSGGIAADFSLLEIYAPAPAIPNGPFADVVRHVSPKHLHDLDASGARYDFPAPSVPVIAAAGDVVSSWASGLTIPWGTGYQKASSTIWLSNPALGAGDDLDHEFTEVGTATGNTINVAGVGGADWMADFAYDWINNTLWQLAVGGDNCVHELNTTTLSVTGNSICPTFGTVQYGLAYNPKTDTFFAGGWNDSTIHEFDRSGTILRSTNVALAISGLAFNPVTDNLFVMVNTLASESEVYIVDVPATGDFVVSGQFDIIGWTDYGGAGLAMDCDGHLWAANQNTLFVNEVDSGESSTCSLDIPWLTESPASGTLTAGSSLPVSLNFDSTGLTAGTVEEGFLRATNSTPYGSFSIPVTMVVEPDQTLNVFKDGTGTGTVIGSGAIDCGATCSDTYPYGTQVTLAATAGAGSTFMGWSGDCTGNGNCVVTMDQARNVLATFTDTSVTTYDLTVAVSGSGSGGVTSSPIGIFCGSAGSTCTAPFDDGANVALIPAPDTGSTFIGWYGYDCSGNGLCWIAMDQPRNGSAVFTADNDIGVLEGTVTDSTTAPIGGATITAYDGTLVSFTTVTAPDGTYSFGSVPAGTYAVTAEKYGYISQTAAGVAVVGLATTTQDFSLADSPFYTLSGTVTDVNTGQPLYAEVDYGFGSIWTNPVTGYYSESVAEGSYTVTATVAASYITGSATVNLATDTVQDFLLQPDVTCSAPGYSPPSSYIFLYSEDFEASDAGYTHSGAEDEWERGTPVSWPAACASGTSCWGTDLDANYNINADNELLSSLIDLSALSAPGDILAVQWSQAIHIESAIWDHAYAEVSINGGAWATMWSHIGSTSQTDWQKMSYEISAAAGGTVQFRWRMTSDSSVNYSGYYIDDVDIVEVDCIVPTEGGFIVGNVYDENTNIPLNGVLVDDGAGHSVTTMTTPGDDNLDDGFYSLYFKTSGNVSLTATKDNYGPVAESVAVPVLATAGQDFNLPAGKLSADPDGFEVHVALNSTLSLPLSIDNSGGLAADFELFEWSFSSPPAGPQAPKAPVSIPRFEGVLPADEEAPSIGLAPGSSRSVSGEELNRMLAPIGVSSCAMDIVAENMVVFPDGGVPTTMNTVGSVPETDYFAGDFLNNDFSKMYVIDYGTNQLYSVSTQDASATLIGSTVPVSGQSWTGMTGAVDGTLYASSSTCGTSTLYTVDTLTGTATSVGVISNAPCIIDIAINDSGEMFGVDIVNNNLVQINPATGAGTIVGSVGINANYAQGMDFEDGSDVLYWAAYSTTGELRTIDTTTGASALVDAFPGGTQIDCLAFTPGFYAGEIPWLTETPTSGTVASTSSLPISLDFDSTGLPAGTETGYLNVTNTTPYDRFSIPVTMVVEPDMMLTIAKEGSGSGDVAADIGPVDCGATCSSEYPYNTAIILTATPTAGSFMGWSGGCTGTNPVCNITMDRVQNVTAFFTDSGASSDHDLGVSITGSGAGSVVSSPSGISCDTAGSGCLAAFADGTVVNLIATEDTDSTFMGWSGECSGIGLCSVTMDQVRYVGAIFTSNTVGTFPLEVLLPGNGDGSVISDPTGIFCGSAGNACTGPFDDGVAVTLTAAPATGTTFAGWSGACTGSSLTCDLTMDVPLTATANFVLDTFDLTVIKDGHGDGTVTSNPAGIDCGSDCTELYNYGSQVVLTAVPDQESKLVEWQGSCNEPVTFPPATTCTVDIYQAEDITVRFDPSFPWPMYIPVITSGAHRQP
ncbi:MAG: carboxypeptidase regulatory-like domain-containing protein [Desulfocapsa sp.]|nr:carboxypeptidase regulatory-like domain-containing protein [Desulfocapsa sp.]